MQLVSTANPRIAEEKPGGSNPIEQPRLRFRLVTGTAFSFVSMVIGQAFGLVTSIMYARILGPGNLGIFAIYTQIVAVAATFATLGMSTPITRFVAQIRVQDVQALGGFLGTVLVATIASSAGASAVLLMLAQTVGAAVYGSSDLALM